MEQTAVELEAYAPPSSRIRARTDDELAVARGVVLVAHPRGVAVDVAEEATPRARTSSSPGGRVWSASMQAWTCIERSSRPPNAPPTPPSTSRTFSGGRSSEAASWSRSTCSHWVAMKRSTPPSSAGTARPDSGPRNAWSCMPTSYSPVTTTSPSASGSPWRIGTWRSRLPLGCSGGASGRARARGRSAARAPRSRPRSSWRPRARSPGGRRRRSRPARPGSGRPPRRARAGPGSPARRSCGRARPRG